MAYTNLCGKKLQAKLGGCLNESATSHSPALLSSQQSFAKRQLEKMGWEEGTGLGKRRNGIQEHVKIKQRENELGLGREKERTRETMMMGSDAWWKDSVGGTLARLQMRMKEKKDDKKEKKEKRKKKEEKMNKKKDQEDDHDENKRQKKKRKKSSSESESQLDDKLALTKLAPPKIKSYTDEELFQATGGARFGMRAQRRAEGKWKRTESGSVMDELEKKAKTNIEWNGRGNAQVLGIGNTSRDKDENITSVTISSNSAPENRATVSSSSKTQPTSNTLTKRKREDDDNTIGVDDSNECDNTSSDSNNNSGQKSKQKKKQPSHDELSTMTCTEIIKTVKVKKKKRKDAEKKKKKVKKSK